MATAFLCFTRRAEVGARSRYRVGRVSGPDRCPEVPLWYPSGEGSANAIFTEGSLVRRLVPLARLTTLPGVRVIVDYGRCESNALCMAAAPEVFEVRDDDQLYLLEENPPESLRAKVEAAVKACPKIALSIED
jgi:ferredoxin